MKLSKLTIPLDVLGRVAELYFPVDLTLRDVDRMQRCIDQCVRPLLEDDAATTPDAQGGAVDG